MAISFISSSNTTYASRTNTTITAPASIADGDLLIAVLITAQSTEAVNPTGTPSGFTEIGSAIDVSDTFSFNLEFRVYRKIASSESGNYTFSHASSTSQGMMTVWRGVDNTTPEDQTSTTNSGTNTTRTWTGLTTVTNNAWIVALGFDWADNANNLTPPTGMTERLEVNPLIYVASEAIATAGATGNRSHTCNTANVNSNQWGGRLLALRPAATDLSFAANGGSYAITGSTVSLERGYEVVPAAGSYAITGSAVSLELGYEVAPASGSYAITGATVALLQTYPDLAVDAGSYAVSGSAVALEVGYEVAADAGSYAISGSAVTLLHGWEVAATAGSYAISGSAVNLAQTYPDLAVGAGSYAITGSDVTLTLQAGGEFSIAVDAGSYTISGSAVSLEHGHLLSAAAGSYAVTGSDVALVHGIELAIGAGSYAVTGDDAALERGWEIAVEAGSYAITGSPVTLDLDAGEGDVRSSAARQYSEWRRLNPTMPVPDRIRRRWQREAEKIEEIVAGVVETPVEITPPIEIKPAEVVALKDEIQQAVEEFDPVMIDNDFLMFIANMR